MLRSNLGRRFSSRHPERGLGTQSLPEHGLLKSASIVIARSKRARKTANALRGKTCARPSSRMPTSCHRDVASKPGPSTAASDERQAGPDASSQRSSTLFSSVASPLKSGGTTVAQVQSSKAESGRLFSTCLIGLRFSALRYNGASACSVASQNSFRNSRTCAKFPRRRQVSTSNSCPNWLTRGLDGL